MKKRIMCFGDSNTWGAIANSPERYPADVRWTGVMQKALGEDYLVIEEGHNGRTTVFDDPIEGRLAGITYFRTCIDSQSPLDLILLMLGTNDLKTRYGVDGRTIAYGFHRYLDALITVGMAGERPRVLLISPILIDPSYRQHPLFSSMFGERADERSRLFAQAYAEFAAEAGWDYFDAATCARAETGDGLHMSPESHAQLGHALAEKVRGIL